MGADPANGELYAMRTKLFQDSSDLFRSAVGLSSLTAVTLLFAFMGFAAASDGLPIESTDRVLDSKFGENPSWPQVRRLPTPATSFEITLSDGAVASDNSGEYEAYRATVRSGYFIDIADGGSFADDIEPIGGPILVTRYEIVVAGTAGPFTVTTQLWSDAGPGFSIRPLAPILGTDGQFSGLGNGTPEHHTQTLSSRVLMPTERFWIAYTVNGSQAGPMIVSDYPEIGLSQDCFVVYGEPDPGQWSTCPIFFCYLCGMGGPCCTFQARVFAAGTEPTGACCTPDSPDGILCHDNVSQTQCAGRFALSSTCADEPFDPPCPLSACCLSKTNCMNLDAQDCEDLNGLWQAGSFCDVGNQQCPHEACIASTNDCLTANQLIPGCQDVTCCSEVCEIDSFCCEAGWDESCVELAMAYCPLQPTDQCSDAVEVPCGGSVIIDNRSATDQASDPVFSCHASFAQNGIGSAWSKFIATAPTARLRTCDSEPPADDSLLAVYSGTCGDLVEIACDDDTPGCGTISLSSEVCVGGLVPGQLYYVQLASWTEADRGRFILELDCPAPASCGLPSPCPSGLVSFVNPPSGVVDARQPHVLNQPGTAQGIRVLTVMAPAGAAPSCFRLCETASTPITNSIATVTNDGSNLYTITLSRPITPLAVTRVAYQPDTGPATVGSFFSHPANVNGDGWAGPVDILAIIDCINGVNPPTNCPWGLYSADIDHSGMLTPIDILRLIDILNGVYACPFFPPCVVDWRGPLPSGTCEP